MRCYNEVCQRLSLFVLAVLPDFFPGAVGLFLFSSLHVFIAKNLFGPPDARSQTPLL